MLYCQDLSRKRPRPDLTLSRLHNSKISISINGIKLSIRVEKESSPDLTLLRQILTCHNKKLGLTILSALSIPNVNKVLVLIMIGINF
jgi:hypothetical protein